MSCTFTTYAVVKVQLAAERGNPDPVLNAKPYTSAGPTASDAARTSGSTPFGSVSARENAPNARSTRYALAAPWLGLALAGHSEDVVNSSST